MTAGRYLHLDEMSPWSDRLYQLEVIGIADEAPGVKTFTFRSDSDRWFRYRPGQFVTLELPADGGPMLRTYTLSSSPSRPFSIAVTVKAQAESVGTRWMFQHLRVGARIRAYGPAGHFTHVAHPAARYLFLSAGSGITPMMSIARPPAMSRSSRSRGGRRTSSSVASWNRSTGRCRTCRLRWSCVTTRRATPGAGIAVGWMRGDWRCWCLT